MKSPYEYMLELASEYGLEWEVLFSYNQGIEMGMTEDEACVFALDEWDI